MNKEFEKRHGQALEVLSFLSERAREEKETLVFLGGSAIQAILKQPRRLSIDLDIYYSGETKPLISSLEHDFKVEVRRTRSELFSFYNVTKDNVLVKVDVTKFPLAAEGSKPYEQRRLSANKMDFAVYTATPDYLLASKFSSLAYGTTGRAEFEPVSFLKDAYDANCLMDEFGMPAATRKYFEEITGVQNKLRKTSYALQQVVESALQNLLKPVTATEVKPTVSKSALEIFNGYLLGEQIRKPALYAIAARTAACVKILESSGDCSKEAGELEKFVRESRADKTLVSSVEKTLTSRGLSPERMHELRVIAPEALLYLSTCHQDAGLKDGLPKHLK